MVAALLGLNMEEFAAKGFRSRDILLATFCLCSCCFPQCIETEREREEEERVREGIIERGKLKSLWINESKPHSFLPLSSLFTIILRF